MKRFKLMSRPRETLRKPAAQHERSELLLRAWADISDSECRRLSQSSSDRERRATAREVLELRKRLGIAVDDATPVFP